MLPGVIKRLGTGTYTVSRRAAPSFVKGRPVEASPTTFTTLAVIQPLHERDRESLANTALGIQHIERMRIMYSDVELKDGSGSFDSDRVTYDGEDYTVVHLERWDYRGTSYWKAFLAKDAEL